MIFLAFSVCQAIIVPLLKSYRYSVSRDLVTMAIDPFSHGFSLANCRTKKEDELNQELKLHQVKYVCVLFLDKKLTDNL